MWHALRAELAYFRPWLLGGLGIASGIVLLLSVLMRLSNDGEGPPIFVVAMFPIIAGMVVSFIAGGQRNEEHRARLLMSGNFTPRQLAWVTVLIPACFVGLSVLALPPMIGLAVVVAGQIEPASMRVTGGFAVQFWAYAQLGPLACESSAARRQGRGPAGFIGWALFAGIILALTGTQFFLHALAGHLVQVAAVLTAMGVAAALYRGRTNFTR